MSESIKYAKIYSEYGLRKMLSQNNEEIIKKEKEYQEVCVGRKYNPLCTDGWKKEIQNDINYLKNNNKILEEALKIKIKNNKESE